MRLNNEEIHFLDTNILLSMVLSDDESYEKSKEYLKIQYCRYVSNTAYTEAKKKIRKIRRISLKITEFSKNYSINNQINPINIEYHLNNIKNGFLKQYENNPFPEGLKEERFKKFVNDFFNNYEYDITDIILAQNNDRLTDIIISAFRISIDKLSNLLKKYVCITVFRNTNKYEPLRKIGLDKTDAKLVEESYCLHIQLNEVVFFITFDKGILRLTTEVKKILAQNIHIKHPMSFIN